MSYLVDLHTHSTSSDGQDTPTALVHKALSTGVRILALTDHDTLSGLAEAAQAAEETELSFVRDVELEIHWPHVGEFHLLGLNLGSNTASLEKALTPHNPPPHTHTSAIIAKRATMRLFL